MANAKQDHNLTYEDGFAHGYEAHRAEQAVEQPKEPQYTRTKWRGLSPEEKIMIKLFTGFGDYEQLIRAIEQALKEKNNGN